MKLKLILILLSLLLLCGCSYTEPEAQFTVTAFGCDKEGGNTQVYLKLTDTDTEPQIFTVLGEGNGFSEALDDIRSKLSKKASFSHCRLILVSSKINKTDLDDFLDLCMESGIPLSCPVSSSHNVEKVLSNKKYAKGEELASLIKTNAEHFGFGGHSALFEIKTALLVDAGKFALPLLETADDDVKIEGLFYYSNDFAALNNRWWI